MLEKQLHVRVSQEEMKALERYAKKSKRTKTDIIREFLRSLIEQKSL
ncbi:MAG: ribbon-helix-helix protein, CopG family [Nostoc sp.]